MVSYSSHQETLCFLAFSRFKATCTVNEGCVTEALRTTPAARTLACTNIRAQPQSHTHNQSFTAALAHAADTLRLIIFHVLTLATIIVLIIAAIFRLDNAPCASEHLVLSQKINKSGVWQHFG